MARRSEPEERTHANRVLDANRRVHSQLASDYNTSEPHFRPENRAKVRRRLESIAERAPSRRRLVDFGCGTGFVIDLAHDLFDEIAGIDATEAMLGQVDLTPGNISVHLGPVEATPFESGDTDVVTAYSFLDHLADHRLALSEAHRILRPGGLLYVDLVPNRLFWRAIHEAAADPERTPSASVDREVDELVNHQQKLLDRFGIQPEDWRLTEPAKSGEHGFDPDELRSDLDDAGFDADIRFEWYLGQAVVMHGTSFEAAAIVDDHLREILPVSRPLFKYLVVEGQKR